MKRNPAKAFTLVELLVTISVLAILAGLTYRIIDVRGVRNRARDSNITTGVDKMIVSVEGFVSARGRCPAGNELLSLIENINSVQGCAAGQAYCVFSVTGFDLPVDCTDNFRGAGGSTQCSYYYYCGVGASTTDYLLVGKSWGLSSTHLGYISSIGNVECPSFVTGDIAAPDIGNCSVILNN